VSDPHELRSLGVCGDLSFECSSHIDQALKMWVILSQKDVSFYTCSRWVKTHLWETKGKGGELEQDFFLNIYFCIILGNFFSSFHLVFWNTLKMNYWCEAFNTILIAFQKKIKFQQSFNFSNISICLNEKKNPMIFVKAHEWNFHMELKCYNQVVFNIWIGISWSSWAIVWIWFLEYICILQYIVMSSHTILKNSVCNNIFCSLYIVCLHPCVICEWYMCLCVGL
jgi:hypothetical protein